MTKRFFILVAMVAVTAWMAGNASANVIQNTVVSGNHFAGLSCGPDGTLATTDDIIVEFDWQWPTGATISSVIRSNRQASYFVFRGPTGQSYDRGGGSTYGGWSSLFIGLETSGSSTENVLSGFDHVGFFWHPAAGGNMDSGAARVRVGLPAAVDYVTTATPNAWHHITAKFLSTSATGGFASASQDGNLLGQGPIDYASVANSVALHGTGHKGFGIVSRMVDADATHNRRWDNLRINGGINGVADDFDSDPVGVLVPGTPSWVIDNDSRPYSIVGGVNHVVAYGGSVYANIPTTDTVVAVNLLSTDTVASSINLTASMDFLFPTTCTDVIAETNAVTVSLMGRAEGDNGYYGAGDGSTSHGEAIQIRVSVVDVAGTAKFQYDVIELRPKNVAGTLKGTIIGADFDHNWHKLQATFYGTAVTLRVEGRDILIASGLNAAVRGHQVGITSSYNMLPDPGAAGRIDNVTVNGTNILDTGFEFETGRLSNLNNQWVDGAGAGLDPRYSSNPTNWAVDPVGSDISVNVTGVQSWEMY